MVTDKNDEHTSWLVMINVVFFAWKAQHRTKPEFSLFAIQGLDVKHCTRGILWNSYTFYESANINEIELMKTSIIILL